MPSARQFDRGIRLTIIPSGQPPIIINALPPTGDGAPSIVQQHIRFSTDASMTSEPQRCAVQIINLSKTTRMRLSQAVRRTIDWTPPGEVAGTLGSFNGRLLPADPIVASAAAIFSYMILEAGYAGVLSKIFEGHCTVPRHRRRGTEWVTTLDGGDAELNLQQGIVDIMFPAGTPASVVVKTLVQQGLGLQKVIGTPLAVANLAEFALRGRLHVHGRAIDGIADILGAREIRWWVEAGQFTMVADLESIPGPPLTCSPEEIPGSIRLLESPDAIDDGGARIRCLLAPGIQLGRLITIVSSELAGTYRVESISHAGDNRSGAFETRAIVRSLHPITL